VVTTRSSLAERVAQSRFREDLFHCLNGIRLTLPPLRERPEDIPLLVSHFAQRAAIDAGLAPVDFDGAMLEALRSHAWPGNVRELEGVVAQAVLLGKLPEAVPEIPATQVDAPEYPRDWTLEQVKQHHMRRVLDACGGNRSAAARRLAISRKTLERKLGNNGD
jgi:DNA-binding NtrC family response regulator